MYVESQYRQNNKRSARFGMPVWWALKGKIRRKREPKSIMGAR